MYRNICPAAQARIDAPPAPCHFTDPDLMPDRPRSRKRKPGARWKPSSLQPMWRKHIKRVLCLRYRGHTLPDDDAGREDFEVLCHASFAGLHPIDVDTAIAKTATLWAPWMTEAEVDGLIDQVIDHPRHFTKKTLGQALNLTQAVRMHLDAMAYSIWPVDLTHEQWKQAKAQKDRERSRNRAKRREKPISAKATAVDLLQRALADGPQTVWRILRLAVAAGLEKSGATRPGKPLRSAREALGIVPRKIGLNEGWCWALPDASKCPQPIDLTEGALSRSGHSETPCISEGALSRSPTPLGASPNDIAGPNSRTDRVAASQGDLAAREVPAIGPAVAASKKENLGSFEGQTPKSISSPTRAATPISEQKEKADRATFFARRRKWEQEQHAARERYARERDAGRCSSGVAQAVIADQRQRRLDRADAEYREREAKVARIREMHERHARSRLQREAERAVAAGASDDDCALVAWRRCQEHEAREIWIDGENGAATQAAFGKAWADD
jgi:hypothetical protein